MIKSTIAVMASLMLVACGKGEDPKITNPEGQKADSVVSTDVDSDKIDSDKIDSDKVDSGKVAATNIDSDKLDSDKLDSDKIDSDKPVLVPRVPAPAAAPAAGLTLTYFSLAG
jgi:major membrane immunogen (membrane-anchored lipoprotein)